MIRFQYQKQFNFPQRKQVKQWLSNCVDHLKKEEGEVVYVFCDNPYILKMNEQYLNHNYETDIITFNYNDENIINAEIYVSVDQIGINATEFNTTLKDELHRVLIHGILHLAGYNDATETEKTEMRGMEDYYLNLRTF